MIGVIGLHTALLPELRLPADESSLGTTLQQSAVAAGTGTVEVEPLRRRRACVFSRMDCTTAARMQLPSFSFFHG